METNDRGPRLGPIEITVNGFPDIPADFLHRIALGVDPVSDRAGRVAAIDLILGHFEDDFVHLLLATFMHLPCWTQLITPGLPRFLQSAR